MRGPATRAPLPNRRAAETFGLECHGMKYTATIARFAHGGVAEIFLSNHKAGSHADTAARDSAVVASLALQFGVPLNTLRAALMRDSSGRASGPLGVALDIIAGEGGAP
jgi:ribonucleoside-diphosphate reductase alpha chain